MLLCDNKNTMEYKMKPDLSLWQPTGVGRAYPTPSRKSFAAVYRKANKTLVVVSTTHYADKDFEMINHCFDKYKPNIAVVEHPHSKTKSTGFNSVSEQYVAGIAGMSNLPVMLADGDDLDIARAIIKNVPQHYETFQVKFLLDQVMFEKRKTNKILTVEQALDIYRKHLYKDWMPEPMTANQVKKWLNTHYGLEQSDDMLDKLKTYDDFGASILTPDETGGMINQMHFYRNKFARDPMMLENVFFALNNYDTVIYAIGSGHLISQKKIFEAEFGMPEIVYDFEPSQKIEIPKDLKLDIKTPNKFQIAKNKLKNPSVDVVYPENTKFK